METCCHLVDALKYLQEKYSGFVCNVHIGSLHNPPAVTCQRHRLIVYLIKCCVSDLRLVEDSEGLRLSLRGVQGVAAGVANKVLVMTQEDDAGTGFRLENKRVHRNLSFIHIHISFAVMNKKDGVIGCRVPRGHPGLLVGRMQDATGCEGVGGAGVGHALARVVRSFRWGGGGENSG